MLKVTLWGTRGSVPVSGAQFLRHGGATTCVEIEIFDGLAQTPKRVIIDCGTGLAELGKHHGFGCREALFLQTHMHWDHIQGFPFFTPLFNPAARFDFRAVSRDGLSFREVLNAQMKKPTFPVGLDIVPARLSFEELAPEGVSSSGELTVRWTELCHPSGSTGFRLDYRGASVVFTGDVEVRHGCWDALVELARGADVLIMDAQYFPEEYASREGFGHSTVLDAVEVAREAGVGRLVLTHHDPSHDDARLDQKLAMARWAAGPRLAVDNGFERQSFELGAPAFQFAQDAV
ncbi:MAG: MBL fold metallo-hydrolase [Bradymonadaceae bacterium]|nr:MBL fold metallo-hydrolase [Lujinxingiaceae bacterium]